MFAILAPLGSGTVLTAASAQAAVVALSEAKYEVLIERVIRIPMRTVSRWWCPSEQRRKGGGWSAPSGTHSHLLRQRQSQGVFLFDASYFTKRGYVVVIEDVRGRYKSPGRFYHGIYEANDGYDTIEWIAKQPWSSGKIGMTGLSYQAAVQQAAAASGAPHLDFDFSCENTNTTRTEYAAMAPSSRWSSRSRFTSLRQAGGHCRSGAEEERTD